jgi:hypothetical protein
LSAIRCDAASPANSTDKNGGNCCRSATTVRHRSEARPRAACQRISQPHRKKEQVVDKPMVAFASSSDLPRVARVGTLQLRLRSRACPGAILPLRCQRARAMSACAAARSRCAR